MNPAKFCEQCGALIAMEQDCDYYRYIRLKYCPQCAADVHRRQVAACMRRERTAARERRRLEKEREKLTAKENELLRRIIQQQRQEILALESKLKL